jgi:hypothetical protein
MSNVPKIVYDRLKAGAPEGAHPDPDLLAAFAEQALLPAEREGVLEHLARCGDCRAVVSLAIPASESAAAPQLTIETQVASPLSPEKRNWFAWPTLRWAALAAGVIVAGALILIPGKPTLSPEDKHRVETGLQELAAAKQPESHKSENAITAELKPAPTAPELRRDKASESKAADAKQAPARAAIVRGRLEANARAEEIGEGTKTRTQVAQGKDLLSGATVANPAAPMPSVPAANETVAVTSAPTLETAQSDVLTVRNEPPPAISKAKAPTVLAAEATPPQKAAGGSAKKQDAATRQFQNALVVQAPQVQWTVAAGTLRRSLDDAVTWQTALPGDNHLLCYAAQGNNVWAGGKAGALYHSMDTGNTWTSLHPSFRDRSLAADVSHIEVRGPDEIILSTSNGESWTTSDNGKTWAIK